MTVNWILARRVVLQLNRLRNLIIITMTHHPYTRAVDEGLLMLGRTHVVRAHARPTSRLRLHHLHSTLTETLIDRTPGTLISNPGGGTLSHLPMSGVQQDVVFLLKQKRTTSGKSQWWWGSGRFSASCFSLWLSPEVLAHGDNEYGAYSNRYYCLGVLSLY